MQLLSITKYLKACSKMFHISKQNVDKNASETFAERLEIIWSSFLLMIMNKLLRKPVLVRKSLFHLFWHWFLTLSFFLSFFHRKLDIQTCFCKIGGKNGKKLLKESFLGYQKGVFMILQFSRSVHLCRKWFSGEKKERKTTLFQATQADQIS